jgi:hypothetical protein
VPRHLHRALASNSGVSVPSIQRAQAIVVALAACALQASATRAFGQPVTDLSRIALCRRCVMSTQPIVTLGDALGDGIIEANGVGVRYSAGLGLYAVLQPSSPVVKLYDSAGRFVRSIGRRGDGPGETVDLRDLQFQGPNLVLLDTRSKLLVLSPTGRVISESRVRVPTGPFRIISDSTLVLASMDRSTSLAGVPLHVVDTRSGSVLKHFGSQDGQNVASPSSGNIGMGWGFGAASVWKILRDPWALEEWSTDGHFLRTILGDLSWLPRQAAVVPGGPPRPFLAEVGVDPQERLWMITRVADASWQQAKRQGTEGLVLPGEMDRLFDARVDVFDIRAKRHLGTITSDEAYVGLVPMDNGFALQRVVFDSLGVPRLVVYRARLN